MVLMYICEGAFKLNWRLEYATPSYTSLIHIRGTQLMQVHAVAVAGCGPKRLLAHGEMAMLYLRLMLQIIAITWLLKPLLLE